MADINTLLTERAKTHESFNNHARITQNLKDVMHKELAWQGLNLMHREALDMIVHKIGRIMAGDPTYADHWDDIAGYAKLPVKFSGTDF